MTNPRLTQADLYAQLITPMPSVDRLKRLATAYKKASGTPHCVVLNQIAQHYGFKDWMALLRAQPR